MLIYLNEPKGERYKKLIEVAFEICDMFIFIKHSQLEYCQSTDNIIDELKDSFIYSREQNEWPGTISVPTAKVFYYKTSNEAKDIISNSCVSLFDWCAPHLPDDLCFIKDGRPWLTTTSHESDCYIEVEDMNEVEKVQKINGLINRIYKK